MTLTEASVLTNKATKYFLLPMLVIMVIWLMVKMAQPNTDIPDNYMNPDNLCGPLPELTIEGFDTAGDIEYSCETTAGCYPDLPEIVNVFQYDHPGQSLYAQREAQQTATLLGFENSPSRPNNTEYKWTDPLTKRTLIIEASNQNIDMFTDFNDPSVNTHSSTLPSEEKAEEIAQLFMQNMSLLTSDYASGPKVTHLIQIGVDGSLSQAPSLSEADLVRVDFTRSRDLITIDPEFVQADELGSTLQTELEQSDTTTITTNDSRTKEIKRYPTHVFNNSPYFGNISVFIGGQKDSNTREYQIFDLKYHNWVIPILPCGTYSLISTQEAVRKVQSGEAALTYLMESNGDEIVPYETRKVAKMTILEITLGYYDDWDRQDYLQPVYVISGDAEFENGVYGKFFYYIPAIDYNAIPENAGIVIPNKAEPTN